MEETTTKERKTKPKLQASTEWGSKIGIVDVKKWDQEKVAKFVGFLDFFYVDGEMRYDGEKMLRLERLCEESPDLPFAEFWRMIGVKFDAGNDGCLRKFFMGLVSAKRIAGNWLREHPELISAELKELLLGRPEYANFFMREEDVRDIMENAEDITMQALELADDGSLSQQQLLEQAMFKVTKVYNLLAASITPAQIKSLPIKDRIGLLAKFQFIHAAGKKIKPGNVNFNNFNIKSGGREELEAGLLDMASADDLE